MTKRSGVLNWMLETLLWLDKRDLLENIKLQIGGKKITMKVVSQKPKEIPVFVIKIWERIRGKERYTGTCCIL